MRKDKKKVKANSTKKKQILPLKLPEIDLAYHTVLWKTLQIYKKEIIYYKKTSDVKRKNSG